MNQIKDFNIVEIRNNRTTVDWHFGNHCQNACSYCPSSLHANNSKKYDLDLLKGFTDCLENNLRFDGEKKIYFGFAGGEPTIHGNFGPFVKFLRERNHSVDMVSNAGRTTRWWEEYGDYFNRIHLSFHSEYTDLEHFASVAELLAKKKKSVYIIMVCWPDKFDVIQTAYKRLRNISGVRIFNKKIEQSWIDKPGVIFKGYTTDQKQWIDDNVAWGFTTQTEETDRFSILDDKGNTTIAHPLILRNFDKNRFLGWQCSMGIKNVSIKYAGNVYGAHCEQLYLGSVYDYEKIQWPNEPSICRDEFCPCASDMIIDKKSPGLPG